MLTNQKAFSIIEIILAMAIFVILTASSITVVISSFNSARLVREEQRALDLAVQGVEVVEALRDQSWTNLSNGSYGLNLNAGNWELVSGSDTDPSGKYERVISISDLNRDSNGDISPLGTADPDSKLISVSVNWDFTPGRPKTISLDRYLTNWRESGSSSTGGGGGGGTVTTCADFCVGLGTYSTGICRQNSVQCGQNGETYELTGDTYCNGVNNADACCCAP